MTCGLGHAQTTLPDGLAIENWDQVRASIESHQHRVRPSEHGHSAANHGQGWDTQFDSRGFVVQPRTTNWSWGLQLESYGYSDALRTIRGCATVSTEDGRITYAWDDLLDEWVVNDRRGLEHGFTLRTRPAGFDGGPLQFRLSVRGGLVPSIEAEGRDVAFVSASGGTVLGYRGLTVLDADLQGIPARFELVDDGLLLTIDDWDAQYPLVIDPVAQQDYFKATPSGTGDNFGGSVALSGDTLVVGAWREDSDATGVDGDANNDNAFGSGAAYVFVREAGVWTQQAYLKASNTDQEDGFGSTVAIAEDIIVVGAPGESSNAQGVDGDQRDNSIDSAGAAYVFKRVSGTWIQVAYLKTLDPGIFHYFGTSVAVSGESVVVGTAREGPAETGAAYVYVQEAGTWTLQARLTASNAGILDHFGVSVGISGDTIVIGAVQEDGGSTGVDGNQLSNNAPDSGAAYVFTRTGGTWTQEAYLKSSNSEDEDRFGQSVAIFEDQVVVGAYFEDGNASGVNGDQGDNSLSASGAAYVFVRESGSWTQRAYLKSSNPINADSFGISVATSGNKVVIGAPNEDGTSTGINGPPNTGGGFNSGAAYVFELDDETWSQRAYLKATNTGAIDLFGRTVTVSGDTVVVGAAREDSSAIGVNGDQSDNSSTAAGAAYSYVLRSAPISTFSCSPTTAHVDGDFVSLSTTVYDSEADCGIHIDASAGPTSFTSFGFFLMSSGGSSSTAVGQGVLCLDPIIGRYGPNVAANVGASGLNSVGYFDVAGEFLNAAGSSESGFGFDVPSILPSSPGISTIQSGDTLFFQLWYRDRLDGATTSNLSDMVEIAFP